jgi:Predicted membrane protein
VYKVNRTKSGALIGMLLGTLCTGIVGGLANYFILIPFYAKMMPIESIIAMCAKIIPSIDSLFKVVLLSIVPFNIFKGLIISAITFLLYKKLTPIINWVYKKVGSNKA